MIQNSQTSSPATLRNQKMSQLRSNLKQMAIVTQTTSRIKRKVSLNRRPTHNSDNIDEVDSLSGTCSEAENLFNFNSFEEKYEML